MTVILQHIEIGWYIQNRVSDIMQNLYSKKRSMYQKSWMIGERGLYFINPYGLLIIALLCVFAPDSMRISEASMIISFVWQTLIPNTNLATRICAWAPKTQMLLADARIRPIAFVPLDSTNNTSYQIRVRYAIYMFAENMRRSCSTLITVVWKHRRWRMGLFINQISWSLHWDRSIEMLRSVYQSLLIWRKVSPARSDKRADKPLPTDLHNSLCIGL